MTVAAIKSRIDPAIVDVDSTLAYHTGESAGTGIVLTSTGEILTNNHVIDGAVSTRGVDLGNGKTYTATVVGYDRSADVAVLQLQGATGLRTASVGDSSRVATGEPVVALGNAGGAGGAPLATAGTVAALHRMITASDPSTGSTERLSGLIESDARLVAGDSGGPLVNARGQVVAMNSAAAAGLPIRAGPGRTRSYSIPINQALGLAKRIEAGHASSTVHVGTTGVLGIMVTTTGAVQDYLHSGVGVAGVEPGSPAGRAGLAGGDVITSVGGKSVHSSRSLRAVVSEYHPGDKVAVTWTDRAGQIHRVSIGLATGPAA
jgi:S1-C subfamily serine protease